MKFSTRLLCGVLIALGTRGSAAVRLPAIFSEHMVLQAGVNAPVWGWAEAGEEITVAVAGQTNHVTAGQDGKWMVKLAPLTPSAPVTLTVTGRNTITIADVLVGDVWLCSGQSNMAVGVNKARDFNKEQATANFPNIRTFQETSGPALSPREECAGRWVVCSTNTVGTFSATAYFFGREIHQRTGHAVGLINSSVPATRIEAWTRWAAQQTTVELKPVLAPWEKLLADWTSGKTRTEFERQLTAGKEAAAKAQADGSPADRLPSPPTAPRLSLDFPGGLFNGKIAPLIPYALRGGIWYQGESNASTNTVYGVQLATMIRDWRAQWGQEFPFAWVQLPEYGGPVKSQPVNEGKGWALVRDGMLQTLALPQTGMAIALGTGENANIHPKNKQEVGRRLALWALATVYGQTGVPWCGPLPAGQTITGSEVVISFTHTDGGLVAKDGVLGGFAIAGADKRWMWANATIANDTVIVSHPDVKVPVAVRYAWADNPVAVGANLYNGAGLPASPFRTDAPATASQPDPQ